MNSKYEIWLGNEASFQEYQQHLQRFASMSPDLALASREQTDGSHLLSQHGSTAVINIQGAIFPFSNWMTQMMGLTTYPDIRSALVEAANSDTVDTIVMDINSPGGSANGIEDVTDLMGKIDKPITAYTNATMASAAYWIASSADKIYASRMATVGSIGVIAVHFDETQMLAQEGVKATVIRSGEYKALGGPYEELSALAKDVWQAKSDAWYSAFLAHVATGRGTDAVTVHTKMGDGKEFLGQEALRVGLIDGIMSIDDLMVSSSSKNPKSTGRTTGQRMETNDMAKKLLSEKTVALIAAGGTVDEALVSAPEAVEPPALETTPESTPAAPEGETITADLTVTATDSLTDYLKTELSVANEKLLQATVDARNLQTQLDAMSATHASMRTIVSDFINVKRIALGGSAADLSAVADDVLVQQYQQTSADFSKTFPIGGRVQPPSVEPPAALIPSNHQARVKAAKI
jgi:signal peptide peptidase SppA